MNGWKNGSVSIGVDMCEFKKHLRMEMNNEKS